MCSLIQLILIGNQCSMHTGVIHKYILYVCAVCVLVDVVRWLANYRYVRHTCSRLCSTYILEWCIEGGRECLHITHIS